MWVNHVIIHKGITLYYEKLTNKNKGNKITINSKKTKNKMEENMGGPVVGKPLCTILVWAWLIVCFFIHLYGSLCVYNIILNISNDRDLIMATTGRNM